jgi:hypothetical protein
MPHASRMHPACVPLHRVSSVTWNNSRTEISGKYRYIMGNAHLLNTTTWRRMGIRCVHGFMYGTYSGMGGSGRALFIPAVLLCVLDDVVRLASSRGPLLLPPGRQLLGDHAAGHQPGAAAPAAVPISESESDAERELKTQADGDDCPDVLGSWAALTSVEADADSGQLSIINMPLLANTVVAAIFTLRLRPKSCCCWK